MNTHRWKHRDYYHQQRTIRARVKPAVEAGITKCARCGELILPGTPWDLGHIDGGDFTDFSGPEHRSCNRATSTHRARKVSRRW